MDRVDKWQVAVAATFVAGGTAWALHRRFFDQDMGYMYRASSMQASVWHYLSAVASIAPKALRAAHLDFGLLPPTVIDPTVSPRWLRRALSAAGIENVPPIKAVTRNDDSPSGGFVGFMARLDIEYDLSGEEAAADGGPPPRLPRSVILKTSQAGCAHALFGLLLGHAREGRFYAEFGAAPRAGSADPHAVVRATLPRIFYAHGSSRSGLSMVVMEDACLRGALPAAKLLGNQCWGDAGLSGTALLESRTPADILLRVFRQMAEVHARYWQDAELLRMRWLKHVNWLHGRDRARWELGMVATHARWNEVLTAAESGKSELTLPPHLLAAYKRAKACTSWEAFRARMDVSDPAAAWTLCHGDYHAGNMLWVPGTLAAAAGTGSDPILVDWAEVGVFCPLTELAQFMVSNATIDVRRAHERDLLRAYHDRLVACGVDGARFTYDRCFRLYQAGGTERWLQMGGVMASIPSSVMPAAAGQWFVDQVAAFVEDHAGGLSDAEAGFMTAYCMPRAEDVPGLGAEPGTWHPLHSHD